MALTREEVLELMVSILGGSVNEATGWTTTGPTGKRNALQTNERMITRALNEFDQRVNSVLITVDGFQQRFNEVVGDNYGEELDDFNEIGSNLIIAINTMKSSLETVSGTISSLQGLVDTKVAANQAIVAGTSAKITYDEKGLVTAGSDLLESDIPTISISKVDGLQEALDNAGSGNLDELESKINNKVDKNTPIVAGSGSKITYDEKGLVTGASALAESDLPNLSIGKITNLQNTLSDKVDNSRVLSDVPANAKFTDTIYEHPTSAGNKHIPSGGSADQYLKYSSNGTAVWSDLVVSVDTGIKIKRNITITSAGWTKVGDLYQYEIVDVDIAADTMVDVNVRLEDLEKASDIKSANNSSAGKVTLYASEKPAEDIICDLKLINQMI